MSSDPSSETLEQSMVAAVTAAGLRPLETLLLFLLHEEDEQEQITLLSLSNETIGRLLNALEAKVLLTSHHEVTPLGHQVGQLLDLDPTFLL